MKKLLFNKNQLRSLVLLVGFLLLSSSSVASHFRHGTISWRIVSGNTVEFKISQAWRNGCNIGVGGTCYSDTLYFGDGQSQRFSVVATAVNAAENWYYGESTFTHTYSNLGNFVAYFASCCKIGQLSNNAHAYWRSETIVNVGSGNESPVTTMAPIINMQTGTSNATFQVPASDPDGDVLTYRLATASEVAGTESYQLQRYSGQPSGFSIDNNTGLITFNTIGKSVGSLWNASIVVEDGETKVINDFIIKIVEQSNPPAFDYTVTPVNGNVYQVSPGVPVNFSVKADDTDPGATVSLQSIGVPLGASIVLSNQNTNSITGNFSWVPTANNLGTNVINFLAQDNVGAQVSTSVTILVSLKPQFDVPPTPAEGVHNVYNPGDVITYNVQASDPDPLDVVSFTDVKGKDMMGMPISLYQNASFSNLNGLPANPTNGTFTWNTMASDWGHKHVYFYATDSYGDVTRHEISQLINTPPVFASNPVLSADVGVAYSYEVVVSDADIIYGDEISIFGNTIPSWLSLTDNGDGTATLSGTPSVSDVGIVSVNIQAEDKNHHQDPRGTINQIFDITVNNCQVNAIAKNISVSLDANGNASILADDVNNGSTATCGIQSISIDNAAFSCENIGYNQVTLTVTDVNNNSSTAVAIVTIEDTTAPVVATNDISVELSSNGSASITTSMINNDSSDACGIKSLTLDKTYFNCANVGVNQVTLTVTDNHGNTSSAMANVIVEDKIAPNVYAENIIVELDENGFVSIDPLDLVNSYISSRTNTGGGGGGGGGGPEPEEKNIRNKKSNFNNNFSRIELGSKISDVCGVATIVADKTNFSCSDVGNNTVNVTVTDVNGNSTTVSANVTVNDVIVPTVETQVATVTLANGEATITPSDVDGGSFDNCSFTLSLDNDRFTCSDIGENTVTLTATDASGNTSSKTAIVNVVGDIPTISINDFNAVQTQKKNTIFLGFGPQSINLSTVTSGGSGFTYEWTTSSGEMVSNEANPTISPEVSTTYNVTVTNSNGCTASTSIYVCVIDARAFDNKGRYKGKVVVCHHTSGKKGTKHVEISISSSAVMTHLTKHGVGTDHADSLGGCNAVCVNNYSSKSIVNTVQETSISENISVYPVPSRGVFDIRLTNVSLRTDFLLFDTNGKLIERKTISAENSSDNIITIGNYNLSSGIYLLKVINQNESYNRKIIVSKD